MRISDWSSDVCASDLAGPMVERPVDILHHIGCLKNRAKQSAHHFLRRCIRSSEEGPCLKVTPFKTVMTVLNGVPVLRAAVFCAQSGISADDVRAKRPDGDRKQVGQKIDAQFVEIGRASCRERVCQYV